MSGQVASDGAVAEGSGDQIGLRVFGTGPRPVLALHCSLAHGGAWAGLGAFLADAVTLTAPDFHGHGRSADWDPDGPNLHDLSVEVAGRLAQQIGAGAPVDLLGHSFGATIALRLALERPDLVRRLVLYEPVLFAAARLAGAPEYTAFMATQDRFQAAIDSCDWPAAARHFHGLWGTDTPLDALPPAQRGYIVDRIRLIPAVDDVLRLDARGLLAPGRLEGLHAPVLLAEGALSPPIIGAVNRALAARMPDLRRLVLPGAGHMGPITHAAALAPEILAHLAPDAG